MSVSRGMLLTRYRVLSRREPELAGKDPVALAERAARVLREIPATLVSGPIDDGQALLLELAASDALARMPRASSRRLIECLAGDGRLLLPRLQHTVDTLLHGGASVAQTAVALSQLVAAFPHDNHMLPVRVGALAVAAPFTLGRPLDGRFRFERAHADARTRRVMIGSIGVDIVMPRQVRSGRHVPSVTAIAAALAALPPWALTRVARVVVEPLPDRDRPDALMARDQGNVVRVYPQRGRVPRDEWTLRLAHEVGHAVATAAWGDADLRGARWQPWREAMERDGVAPSGYGRQRPAEDFAEMFALATLGSEHMNEVARLFPARMALLTRLQAQCAETRADT